MKARELKERLLNKDISRRGFNKALAAVGLATATMPLVPNKAAAAGDLVVMAVPYASHAATLAGIKPHLFLEENCHAAKLACDLPVLD